jgi:hypothetical protein
MTKSKNVPQAPLNLSILSTFIELQACSISLFPPSKKLYMNSAENASGIDIEHDNMFDMRSGTENLHFGRATACSESVVTINESSIVTDR